MQERYGYKGGGSSASSPKQVKLDQGSAQRATGKNCTYGKDATMGKQSGRNGGYKPH